MRARPALLCLLVLLCFAGTPALSRFPASMLGWRLVCDALLSVQVRSAASLSHTHRPRAPSAA